MELILFSLFIVYLSGVGTACLGLIWVAYVDYQEGTINEYKKATIFQIVFSLLCSWFCVYLMCKTLWEYYFNDHTHH